jgi:choline dehydrogenase-like flavoprotein
MLIDARGISSGTVIESDVAIIGAGAAGISLALELAGKGFAVCLLESGGTRPDWDNQSLYRGKSIGLPHCPLDVCQLRYLGGNTNAWGGWCRPLEPIDFEARPWVEWSGWPFPATELTPYYRRAHEICQTSDDYVVQHAVDELRHPRAAALAFDPDTLETLIYRFSPPTRFGRTYRGRLMHERSLRCLLHANVLGIKADVSGRNVTRLSVGTFGGVRFEVVAKHYVLAAGGVENARLLLLSNDVVSEGLGNRHGLVGRFYMDHPHTRRRLIVASSQLDSGLYGELFRGRRIMARIALPEAVQKREKLLGYSANLHPMYFGHDSPGWAALRDTAASLSRSRRSDPYHRVPPYAPKRLTFRYGLDMARYPARTAAAGLLRLIKPNRFVTGFMLESKPEQAPNPASRLTLDDEVDAFGLRRIKVDWRMLPIDRHTAVRGEELVDLELRRLGIGELAPLPAAEIEGWPDNLESGWHQLGTTRMHDEEKHGVVDAASRVHGMSNLYVVGGSVFPTGGTAPPTLTIVALALRLAAHLTRTVPLAGS